MRVSAAAALALQLFAAASAPEAPSPASSLGLAPAPGATRPTGRGAASGVGGGGGAGLPGCRDRLPRGGCAALLAAGNHSCATSFCDTCGNMRRRCDATCGFCSGAQGASRAAVAAAAQRREERRSAPAVGACYHTRLGERQIREHACEGVAAGATACFIDLKLHLAGCCFLRGTAPPGRDKLVCSPEARVCTERTCNTPVPLLALPPGRPTPSGRRPSAGRNASGTQDLAASASLFSGPGSANAPPQPEPEPACDNCTLAKKLRHSLAGATAGATRQATRLRDAAEDSGYDLGSIILKVRKHNYRDLLERLRPEWRWLGDRCARAGACSRRWSG